MGRMAWAFVGVLCGAVVGGIIAVYQLQTRGEVSLKLTVGLGVTIAFIVVGWAERDGVVREPEGPPTLSLMDHESDDVRKK